MHKHIRLTLNLFIAGLLFLMNACTSSTDDKSKDSLVVVTTTTMITDLVSNIVKDGTKIEALMGSGVDPHLYKASASDVRKLTQADIVFYNGLMLEGRMIDVFERMKKQGHKVYAVAQSIPESELIMPDGAEGHFDPHVWLDPRLWELCIDTVVEGLSMVDQANAVYYERRGDALKKLYKSVDIWVKKKISELEKDKRILITSHDAYNYFGLAYDFNVIGIQGISTTTEAGLADIARVSDYIRKNKIPAIFVESSVAPNVIERISSDSGAKVGGEIFSDAMGATGEVYRSESTGEVFYLDTWEGMIKYNVEIIVESLK